LPNDEDEADLNTIRRVEANDPVTTHEMGMNHYIDGGYGSSFNTISKMQPSWAMWNLSAAATIIAVAADDGTGRRMGLPLPPPLPPLPTVEGGARCFHR